MFYICKAVGNNYAGIHIEISEAAVVNSFKANQVEELFNANFSHLLLKYYERAMT